MGASLLTLKVVILCGTLSSSTRNFSRGTPGRKCPLLSRTATSNWMVVTSLWKVGVPSGTSLSFLLNFDGIFGSSEESVEGAGLVESVELELVESEDGAGASFFLGRATVSEESGVGPCCAIANGRA